MNAWYKIKDTLTYPLTALSDPNLVNTHITTLNRYLEPFIPLPTHSQMITKGTLTPDEWKQSCDFFCKAQYIWNWASFSLTPFSFLPPDKQALVARQIPFSTTHLFTHDIQDEDWILSQHDLLEQEERCTHRYDLTISYDKFYRVPRLWIQGFTSKGERISPEMVLHDLSADHASKTVTIERYPFADQEWQVTIHPCHIGDAMQRLIQQTLDSGSLFHLHNYMSLFLKLLATIMPYLEYEGEQGKQA